MHGPAQCLSRQPFAGTAFTVTTFPPWTDREQRDGHEMPPPTTLPLPVTLTCSFRTSLTKRAVTFFGVSSVISQSARPLQDPLQPANRMPAAGVAERLTIDPESQLVVQAAVHARPGASLSTVPLPLTVTFSGVCVPRRCSQAESWMSDHDPEWP